MSMGAQRADAQPEDGTIETAQHEWLGLPEFKGSEPPVESWAPEEEPEERPAKVRALSILLLVLALAWTAAAIWSIWRTSPALTVPNLMQWLAFVSPPLILLGVAWLLLGQTPRRETERFTRAISAMRTESTALESVLTIVAARLEENHSKLRNEAAKLMSLGDEASDRLGRVAYYLSKESGNLDKKAAALETAAEAARVDIGVLLADLPRAEEQARAVSQAMKDAGLAAHEQAGALEAQLSALAARGREADEQVGGAAQRLGAHLARVESTTSTAAARMDEAAASMSAVVDETMARASEALDSTRSSLDAQGAALLASIEQSRAAFHHAGEEATRSLSQRLELIGSKVEALAGTLAAQDAASHTLLSELSAGLSDLDRRFAELRETGSSGAEQLGASLGTIRSSAEELFRELGGGQERARDLIGRAQDLSESLVAITARLQDEMPAALIRVEEQAERTRTAATAIEPHVVAIEASATSAAQRLTEAETSISRHQDAFEASGTALTQLLNARLGEIEERFASLREAGSSATSELDQAIAAVRTSVSELAGSLDGGQERAADISSRAREIDAALAAVTNRLNDEIPAALVRAEEQAERTRGAMRSIEDGVSMIEASANNTVAWMVDAEGRVASHREAFASLSETLARQVDEAEARFASLRESGASSTTELGQAIESVRSAVSELAGALEGGQGRADEMSLRAREIGSALAVITSELEERAPAALTRVEEQAARTRASAAELVPQVEAIQTAAAAAAERIAEAERSLAHQQEQLDRLLARISEGVATAQTELHGLGAAASEAEGAAGRIVSETAPELIEALVRVREASNQAATHAREAITSVIPQSVAALADASREAVGGAITEPVEQQIRELSNVAERAVEAAKAASERLTRQMLKIGESAAAVEQRIDEARREQDARESDNSSRRVALLIESLNSTAIDVTKILSNEVTDSAWTAYLKGDRGVFTRRAVRLLDNSEAREIVQHYENEPEFREQVNRYIADFESMLRRILSDRDSSALGVTILSSDMGKLYVALAQAIERLR